MTESFDPIPDADADEQEKAAATESYGGVPVSDEELADVWEAKEQRPGDETPAAG